MSADSFQKLTQIEHVRKRPDTYIGSIATTEETRWCLQNQKMIQKKLKYNPGLEQCILELLTNAVDHSERCIKKSLEPVTKIDINLTSDSFTVKNNGQGIPIEKKDGMYIPEMIFGHLLTSSNYNDSEQRNWNGTNGLGCKVCNIFSKSFTVEVVSSGQKYEQTFSDNLSKKTDPKIKACKLNDYTKITFCPDFSSFKMKSFDDYDNKLILEKRIYDITAMISKKITVSYNDAKLPLKSFGDYVELYTDSKKIPYEDANWSLYFAMNPYDVPTQVSFVNGIATEEGGTHVNHVMDQVVKKVVEHIEKMPKVKKAGIVIKPAYVREKIIVFVKASIVNPRFGSQTKTQLKSSPTEFGSRCTVPDDIISKICKLGLVEEIIQTAEAKQLALMKKETSATKKSRISDVPKLDDANFAGTKQSNLCTLILTEGDSVAGDTPLTLKTLDNKIIIINIEDLTNEFKIENNKEYGKSNYEIWTDRGWTKIKHIMRHKTSKKMYRILTHTGCVDVTEDHSLLKENEEEISPKFCNINDTLLHSFPLLEENKILLPDNIDELEVKELWKLAQKIKIRYYQGIKKNELIKILQNYRNKKSYTFNNDLTINKEEAYVMGLFFADGSCGIYKNGKSLTWGIVNTNLSLLEKCKDIMVKIYGKNFSIYPLKITPSGLAKNCINLKPQYKLSINGGNATKYIIEKYRELLYYKKYKYINSAILNTSREVRQEFFNGYYDGDGQHNLDSRMKMDINSKITSHCVFTLCNGLGYQTSINHNFKKPKIYTIGVSKGTFQKDPTIIKKIIELPLEEQYVYDLETENHHFQAGIGQLIVHNSAKSMVLSGLAAIPNAKNIFGIFPLKGKLLNVKTATVKQLSENEELININKILGLSHDLKSKANLRYHNCMVMTDSDVDGFHIKALLMNYFTEFWPEIVKDDFINTLLTPVVKVTIPKIEKVEKKVLNFYNTYEHEKWVSENKNIVKLKDFKQKYYKGLATSTPEEAKEYFKNILKNRIYYEFNPERDIPKIKLAFDKTLADDRKEWISKAIVDIKKNGSIVDYTQKKVPISSFIDNELVLFSIYDCSRSLPNMMDGLKVSQRKVLFGTMNFTFEKETVQVAQLSSFISGLTHYHHGEVSLQGTIINMAQNFVSSGNAQVLVPVGQFGTRNEGGADAGSPRYIFTKLKEWIPTMYNEYDSKILDHNVDDSIQIEPKMYVPVLPMILLNGATGIGTGWSCDVPCFNPKDIIANIKLMTLGKAPKEMIPWYKGFKGTITATSVKNKWVSRGQFTRLTKKRIHIIELPIGLWYENFKDLLKKYEIINFLTFEDNLVTDKETGIDYDEFTVTFTDDITDEQVVKLLKLESNISATNMVGFSSKLAIKKYSDPLEILKEFYEYRLNFYGLRKKYMCSILEKELNLVSEKARFIKLVVSDKIVVFKRSKKEVSESMTAHKFSEEHIDLFLEISIVSFTTELIKKLESKVSSITEELNILKAKSEKVLWTEDLDKLNF